MASSTECVSGYVLFIYYIVLNGFINRMCIRVCTIHIKGYCQFFFVYLIRGKDAILYIKIDLLDKDIY